VQQDHRSAFTDGGLKTFQQVWAGANGVEKADSGEGQGQQPQTGPLAAALGGMQPADLRALLLVLLQPAFDSAAKASSGAA
jgi:hypothetical protein